MQSINLNPPKTPLSPKALGNKLTNSNFLKWTLFKIIGKFPLSKLFLSSNEFNETQKGALYSCPPAIYAIKNGDNIERMVKTSEIFLLYKKKMRDQRDVPFWCKKKFYEIIGTTLVEILCFLFF